MTVKTSETLLRECPEIETRYDNAESILQGLRTQSLVQNDSLQPRWIENTPCFWYQRYEKPEDKTASLKTEFRLVDTQALSNEPAFDHPALAQALAIASAQTVDAEALPIELLSLSLVPLSVNFKAFNKTWCYNDETQVCEAVFCREALTPDGQELLSPDGRHIAFARDYNLWVRDLTSGEERALTHDGQVHFCYAAGSSASGVGDNSFWVLWSPDSQRLFTSQRDTREVNTWPMVDHRPSSGELRPTLKPIKLAYQSECVETQRLLSIDLRSGQHCEVDCPPLVAGIEFTSFFSYRRRAWWSSNSRHAYVINYTGVGYQTLHLLECDTETGVTRSLLEEHSNTYVNFQPEYVVSPLHRHLPESNELIWWSERSGNGHLYLYDLNTGELKNPITRENDPCASAQNVNEGWRVREMLHVDTQRRECLIQTAGRSAAHNPYYRDLCRVHIDTGEFTTLLAGDDEYSVHSGMDIHDRLDSGVSPCANRIVTTRSRSDRVPEALLLNRDGQILMALETAQTDHLPKHWQWPEPVKMLAADKHTPLYGTLFRPSAFDESKQYPVINMIVGSPWLCAVPHGSFHNSRGYADRHYFQAASVAELGFMVLVIDSRGTPLRNKAFQDINYGWLPDGTRIDDHCGGIEQLAERYPQMDVNRAGLYCPTGYPGGIYNLLGSDNFYRVGVINNLIDTRLMSRSAEYIDKHQGPDELAADKVYPETLADQWNGKLLLVQTLSGWASGAYAAGGSLRQLEALQQANKDVDLIVRSNDGVAMLMSPYEQRRCWDYFVTHLQGVKPPEEYVLGSFNQ